MLVLVGCLLFLSLATTKLQAAQEPAEQQAQTTAAELKKTLAELNALDRWFSESEAQRTRWLVDIQAQDLKIADSNKQVNITRQAVNQTNQQLIDIEDKNVELNKKRKVQAALIGEHVAAAYRLSGQDFLKQLLNQESPDQFERMIKYHQYFSDSRLEVLSEYQNTLQQLAESNQALNAQKSLQQSQLESLQQEQRALKSQRDERASLIANLDAQTETKQEQYQRLQQDRTRLEALLEELRSRSNQLDGSAFVAAKGQLRMPVQGRVRHAFGSKRAEGRLIWHGIDIRANQGASVQAVFRGRVIFSDWLRGFGLLTVLDHGSGYMTLYGHTDVLNKKEGDWVESGETIAQAGSSGGRNNIGVYFEVRHKGQALDPINWISR